MTMIKDPRWSAINFDGTPAAGAKMFVYQAGTDILANLYTASNFQVPLSNPLIADGFGYFPIAHTATGDYKIRIESANGVLLSQVDSLHVD